MKHCPVCNGADFKIEVTFSGCVWIHLTDNEDNFDVTDSDPTDSEWQDHSGVSCMDCDWAGTMADLNNEEEA